MSEEYALEARTLCAEIVKQVSGTKRHVVGIAGPPASGKSTFADTVVGQLNGEFKTSAALLPMDGFHLDNRLLRKLGLLHCKGAPETFDANAFCQLVSGLQDKSSTVIHPIFDRSLDISIAAAGVIEPEIDVVIVEGNYLLLQVEPWSSLQGYFDRSVFIDPPIKVLEARLVKRWLDHGLDARAAEIRVQSNDLPNAQLVLEQSTCGDIRIA